MSDAPIWDDLFHGCALLAFVELARECGDWPDSTAVKARAYLLFEEALAEKNEPPQPTQSTD